MNKKELDMLQDLLNIRKKLMEYEESKESENDSCSSSCCCENENENNIKCNDLDEEENHFLNKIQFDYQQMYKWAFSIEKESRMDKKKMIQIWNKNHPDLPKLILPYYVPNDVSNMMLLFQVIPHWHEYKKNKG